MPDIDNMLTNTLLENSKRTNKFYNYLFNLYFANGTFEPYSLNTTGKNVLRKYLLIQTIQIQNKHAK